MLTEKQRQKIRALVLAKTTIAQIRKVLDVPKVEIERERLAMRQEGLAVPDARRKSTRDAVLVLLDAGCEPREIVARLGVCYETVMRYRREK